jgi:hypothetical protein
MKTVSIPGSEQAQREHARIRGVRVKAIQSDLDVIELVGEIDCGVKFTRSAGVIIASISRRAQQHGSRVTGF